MIGWPRPCCRRLAGIGNTASGALGSRPRRRRARRKTPTDGTGTRWAAREGIRGAGRRPVPSQAHDEAAGAPTSYSAQQRGQRAATGPRRRQAGYPLPPLAPLLPLHRAHWHPQPVSFAMCPMLSGGASPATKGRQPRPQTDNTTPSQGAFYGGDHCGSRRGQWQTQTTLLLHSLRCRAVLCIAGADARVGEVAASVAGVIVAMQIHRKPTFKAPIYLTGVVVPQGALAAGFALLALDSMEFCKMRCSGSLHGTRFELVVTRG